MKHATLRQLKVFEAVARLSSYSRAAEELHLTQPAVSMQVQSLEDLAGLPLTEQIGKKIRLTPAGDELAALARHFALQLRDVEEALAGMKGAEGGRLIIGVVSTAKYFAPALLAEFKRRHPGIELRLAVSNRSVIVRQLAENEIDLAIMGSPPRDFDTVAEAFAEHPLVFVAAPSHPLAGVNDLTPAVFAQETLLIREPGSGTRSALEAYLEERRIRPAALMEMSDNETIKQAAMAGLGVALISRHTIGLELTVGRLALLDVRDRPHQRHWHVVHRKEKRLLPAAESFRHFMRGEGARLLGEQVAG